MDVASGEQMPDELDPRHLRRRLLELAALIAVVVILLLVGPGLGSLRSRLKDASPGWLIAAAGLELLSALSYVVVFRAVFCPRMSWRLSYQIGISEQAANSLLPAGGAGGLALGAWALRRGGMSAEHIGRRTVAFFLLTSLANVGTLIVFAAAFAVGVLGSDPAPAVTYGFGAAAVAATAITLALPVLVAHSVTPPSGTAGSGRLRTAAREIRNATVDGVRDAVLLLRQRSLGVIGGALGYMAFDIAVLGVCFRAFGASPSFGVLVVAYLIGQLGGSVAAAAGRDRRHRRRLDRRVCGLPRAARRRHGGGACVSRVRALDPGRARKHRVRPAPRDATTTGRTGRGLPGARRFARACSRGRRRAVTPKDYRSAHRSPPGRHPTTLDA